MLEFSNESCHTSRKVHSCTLCDEIIPVKTQYIRLSGKYDGQFFDDCYHTHCRQIVEDYCNENGEDEYVADEVIQWLNAEVCCNCKHSWYGDGDDDCETSVFKCEKVTEWLRNLHKTTEKE